MKNILLLLVIILAVISLPVLANDGRAENARAIKTLNKEFKGAEMVSWRQAGDFQMASFGYHGHHVEAYFSAGGELVGCCRDLLLDELPAAVIRMFEDRFAEACYVMIHEISNLEGTCYWITLDAGNKRYHVKSDANGNVLKSENLKSKA